MKCHSYLWIPPLKPNRSKSIALCCSSMLAYGSETLQFFGRKWCWFSLLIRVVNPSIHLTQRTCVSGCDEAQEDYYNPHHQGNHPQQSFISCSFLRSYHLAEQLCWEWRGSGSVLRGHKSRVCSAWGGIFFVREVKSLFHLTSLWGTNK